MQALLCSSVGCYDNQCKTVFVSERGFYVDEKTIHFGMEDFRSE